ncbi:MAG TPA: hypothetical protein K8U81_10780 [Phocaeicola coprocola]|uniref:Uncharacterized protein n=1 Tax=Phocaeicola coprocola TaxID=310298 RepID=A0A921K3R9_9BACT|nr:hypothetical protein [Phocaeicola coprocola]
MNKLWNRIHNFITDQERLDFELNWIKKIWYIILVIITSKYVLCNFSELVSFTFFEKFNGKNLIFLVWIVLLLLPLFDNFEGFGIRFSKHAQKISKVSKEMADEALNHPNKDVEELKKELENIKKDVEK